MYLPLAAVLTAGTLGIYQLFGRRSVALLLLPALAFTGVSLARTRLMQDEVSLWADTAAKRPSNARAHASYALAQLERGHAEAAVPAFLRALALDPSSFATEQNLANAYAQLGRFDAAATHFRRALTLSPSFASAHNGLGVVLAEQGQGEAALESYRTALAHDPDHRGAHQNLARLLFSQARFTEALFHYQALVRLSPADPEAHYNLGLTLARAGDLPRAKASFATSLKLRPDPAAYLGYARFLHRAGDTDAAVQVLEEALRQWPEFGAARQELATLGESR